MATQGSIIAGATRFEKRTKSLRRLVILSDISRIMGSWTNQQSVTKTLPQNGSHLLNNHGIRMKKFSPKKQKDVMSQKVQFIFITFFLLAVFT